MVDVVVKGILNLSIILNTTARDSRWRCTFLHIVEIR